VFSQYERQLICSVRLCPAPAAWTLIAHFLNVSWGPVIPAGEACVGIEATKGNNSYALISDGDTQPYRVRIRTPSFPRLQMVPLISRGHLVPDLLAILGSIDFVMAEVDR
jgi:NADH-quinone oxidoreductase subunit C/D